MVKYIALYELGDKDTNVGVVFPDFPGCVSMGDDYDEAVRMAHEALAAQIETLELDGEPIPTPRTLEQIKAEWEDWEEWEKDGNFIVGTVSYYPIKKPCKYMIYMDAALMARVDEVTKNRSAFLSEAVKAMLDNRSNRRRGKPFPIDF